MINIPPDQIPELPVQEIINDQCVAYGAYPEGDPKGILVHYLELDLARLITWEDIVILGNTDKNLENSKFSDDDSVREIDRPVIP